MDDLCQLRPHHTSWRLLLVCVLVVATTADRCNPLIAGSPESVAAKHDATSSTGTDERVHAYFASEIWTGLQDPIADAVLVVQQGQILAVGPRDKIEVPATARRHELGRVTIIPGLVVAQSNLLESSRSDSFAISPQVRAVDGYDPFDDYDQFLAGGVTTIQITPNANRLMPGQAAVVKLSGSDLTRRVLNESESLSVVLTPAALSPPTIYEPPVGAVSVDRPVEPTQPQLATSLVEAIAGLRAFWQTVDELTAADADIEDDQLQALKELKQSQTPVRWNVNSAAEIRAALDLSGEFQLPWILVDPQEVGSLTSQLDWSQANSRGVILNAEMRPGQVTNPAVRSPEQKQRVPVWERAAQLIAAGAEDKLAFRAANDGDNAQLLFLASLLGRGQLTSTQILKTLTINPARLMGVSDRVGSLQPQADADFVVLSGQPLEPGSRVLATYVDGEAVFEASPANDAVVIRASAARTATGWLSDASLTIVDGKIQAVGPSTSLPRSARIQDFGSAVVVPGYLDLSSRLGIGSSLSETLGLGTKLGDLLNRDDERVELACQGGVTTVLLSSSRLPSPVVAFKLGQVPRALKDPVALRFELKGNLTDSAANLRRTLAAGRAYAEAWKKYDTEKAAYEKQLAAYEVAKKKYDAAMKAAAAKRAAEKEKAEQAAKEKGQSDKDSEKPTGQTPGGEADNKEDRPEKGSDSGDAKTPPGSSSPPDKTSKTPAEKTSTAGDKQSDKSASKQLVEPEKPKAPKAPRKSTNSEPYRQLFAGELVAMVDASETKAVELAVQIFRQEFKLKTAIVSGYAAAASAELLHDNHVLTVVGPTLVEQRDGVAWNVPAELAVARAAFAFRSQATTGAKDLPSAIAYAVHLGLGADEALAGLTTQPAEFLGLDGIGQLAPGNDADLVVLSGPPLHLSTKVLAVMIDGEWVYQADDFNAGRPQTGASARNRAR